ncbi:hypothetical protein ACFYPN_15800 [Streptomyces sp. NPDC005576]|uniref:hypothetical protein n=1 Tax=Streptomyces sp. NPDC005576 TaxID=3364726 RepID=UPI0036CE091D
MSEYTQPALFPLSDLVTTGRSRPRVVADEPTEPQGCAQTETLFDLAVDTTVQDAA